MVEVFGVLAVVLGAAAGMGVVARFLRQPLLLGYVAAGMVLANNGWLAHEQAKVTLELLGQFGVTLLLFLVGLEMPVGELRKMGRVAMATGLGQIAATSLAGYFIVRALGFDPLTALYLAIALSFSSTVVIVKLLSEKRELQSLHGKIAVGLLLVQDFVAIGILAVLSSVSRGELGLWSVVGVMAKALVMVGVTLILSVKIVPAVADWLGRSTELLFVSALAWCLAVAAVVASPFVGFSLEVGGFLAGLAMASAPEHLQILARVRPLRDFFLMLFFAGLGAGLNFGGVESLWRPALVLSGFVLVADPLIAMTILGVMGFGRRTSFLTGLTAAQISEFSLIMIALASKVGHVAGTTLTLVTLVGVVTMTTSTYMMLYSDRLYRKLGRYLTVFERRRPRDREIGREKELRDHIVLFGHSRTGEKIRPVLEKMGSRLLVVDFNPSVVDQLKKRGVLGVFGDMGDYELYEEMRLADARLIVSTVSEVGDNLTLLEALKIARRRGGGKQVVVVTAADAQDAQRLYEAGADYVLVPHSVGGEYLARVLEQMGQDKERVGDLGRLHLAKILEGK